jgi:hypothetical protein
MEEAVMTDERPISLPGTDPDESDPKDESRRPSDRPNSPATPDGADDRDTNPLLREGPDAPDAADIEDPDEQL